MDAISWEQFLGALTGYRDNQYIGRSAISAEHAYLSLLSEFASVPISARADHADSLVLFLNRWACRFPREEAAETLRRWLSRESDALEVLVGLSVMDSTVPGHCDELNRLHESLIELRRGNPRIFTMSDACASKILHQMVPELCVMWDAKIRPRNEPYGKFMERMHSFAIRLRDDLAPTETRDDIEAFLQKSLQYPVRKTLAKYMDECNWFLVWS